MTTAASTTPPRPPRLLDRQGLVEALRRTAAERADDAPLTLALVDLDHFKEVNDDFGHAVGDEVLRNVERLLTGSLPADTSVARIGGDEFAAAFPDTPAEGALILFEEVRQHFANRPAAENLPRRMTLSVGLATLPTHAADPEELFRAADDALYRAKLEGRGRVAIYVESKMVLKSNYYPRAALDRLSRLSDGLGRTEASLLREALDDLVQKYREQL